MLNYRRQTISQCDRNQLSYRLNLRSVAEDDIASFLGPSRHNSLVKRHIGGKVRRTNSRQEKKLPMVAKPDEKNNGDDLLNAQKNCFRSVPPKKPV
uniref:Uncharacterized protein n=1 Tax=Romanomermis culicivorax TaxID=13658 RepID=A0A915IHP1_ROMCU